MDVEEAAVAIDQRNRETHGIGQRLIQCIAAGNMPGDLTLPIQHRFQSTFVSYPRWQPLLGSLPCRLRFGEPLFFARAWTSRARFFPIA
jgi:hypothetical protein